MAFPQPNWLQTTNIYEVNIRQYTPEGTISAFARELPRLKEMGVETLWFMPLTPISEKNRKGTLGSYYACSDYCSINPEFGTDADFRGLVKAAHAMGFKVIVDWVANHTGWDHIWTVQHPGYYKRNEATGDFKTASGMEDIIELNYENPELRQAMIDALQFWVDEFGVDGFRCDLAFWVQLDFWTEARAILDKNKPLFWFGEFDPLEKPEYYDAFDAAYTWTWMHQSEAYCKAKIDFSTLRQVLDRYRQVCGDGRLPVWFTSNHDENSWNGTEYEKFGQRALPLAVFSLCWDGLPMIYGGQEMPCQKRIEFFEKDYIGWDGSYRLHDFYKTLLSLRKTNTALRSKDSPVKSSFAETGTDAAVLAFFRESGDDQVLVVCSFSDSPVELRITAAEVEYRDVFSGDLWKPAAVQHFRLEPFGYRVLEKVK